jgi:prophage DNA circulation protein
MARAPLVKALRPASFRGVPFQVAAADIAAGRRVQVHEYPQRDKPWVEDLGRATREVHVEALLVGDNYVAQANSLLAALEEAGPGELVHPWLGTLRVSLKDMGRVGFDSGLGVARVSLAFVEAGDLVFPAASEATQSASRIATDNLQVASVAAFASTFSVAGFADYVEAAARGNLQGLLGQVGADLIPGLDVLKLADRCADAVQATLGLLAHPESIGWTIVSALGLSGLAGTSLRWASIAKSLVGLSGVPGLADKGSGSGSANRVQLQANANAVAGLIRQTLLAEAVGASSLMAIEVMDDAAAVRNSLVAALDAESLIAGDDVYAALLAARAAVWADINARSRNSARVLTFTPPDVLPALVLAYDRYEDALRGDEIVTRNAIRHPSFVPVRPLQVLSQ